MKIIFDNIRVPTKKITIKQQIIYMMLIFLVGIFLGIFAKWLDLLVINDSIWWQHLIGVLDLRNVFSEFSIWLFLALLIAVYSRTPLSASLHVFFFFLGMTISYHLYTIVFGGFNPKNYMMIWYGITLLSPVMAFLCWYAKGEAIASIFLSGCILMGMFLNCFSIGMWYFDLKSILDLFLFLGSLCILYTKPKNLLISLAIAIAFACSLRMLY